MDNELEKLSVENEITVPSKIVECSSGQIRDRIAKKSWESFKSKKEKEARYICDMIYETDEIASALVNYLPFIKVVPNFYIEALRKEFDRVEEKKEVLWDKWVKTDHLEIFGELSWIENYNKSLKTAKNLSGRVSERDLFLKNTQDFIFRPEIAVRGR